MSFQKSNRGFTLIELLVVISIIGLLSSVVLASLNSARLKARDAKRVADLSEIRNALELFYSDHGYYPPAATSGGNCSTGNGVGGWNCNDYDISNNSGNWAQLQTYLQPYLSVLPTDPTNTGGSCGPWSDGCYVYAYGNVGRPDNNNPATMDNITNVTQYDLTAQLEDAGNPNRCGVRNYKWYFNNQPWCAAFGGNYSNQIYEASQM